MGAEWWIITREYLDLVMMEEPYQGLALLINMNSCQYIMRVLGSSR